MKKFHLSKVSTIRNISAENTTEISRRIRNWFSKSFKCLQFDLKEARITKKMDSLVTGFLLLYIHHNEI